MKAHFFDLHHAFQMSRFVLRQRVRIALDIEEQGLGLDAKKIFQKDQDLLLERFIVLIKNLGQHRFGNKSAH